MGAPLRYSCTALLGLNKAGIIKPNSDGYYELVLSALNYPNPVGAKYRVEAARRIIEQSPYFMRKVKEGNLLGENGHPRRRDYRSDDEYMERLHDIVETNVCLHISDVWIDDSGALKDREGRSYVGIMGLVKPSGEKGHLFEESLHNPKQNTCLSVRSITDNYRLPDGSIEKDFVNIIAWDWVNEPGLRPANKFSAPSLENFEMPVNVKALERLVDDRRLHDDGLESGTTIQLINSLEMIKHYSNTRTDTINRNAAWMSW